MTEKQFKNFWDGLNDNLRAFLVSTFERYEYQVTHTWVRKKQNWMVQRYNTATQMCRVIVNWMQSSLNYGCRDCYSAYARYKTVESKHFWHFISGDPGNPLIKELWNAATAKLIVTFNNRDMEKELDRFDQEQMYFSEIEDLFEPYGCLVKKKKEIRIQYWAAKQGKHLKTKFKDTSSYYPAEWYRLGVLPANQFKDKWLKEDVMKVYNEVANTYLTWEEAHRLRPKSDVAPLLKRDSVEGQQCLAMEG